MTILRTDKIWIELPDGRDAGERKEICDKANAMLAKLGINYPAFAPNEDGSTQYIFWQSENGLYTELADNGLWLNLDYLAK